jgi:hypothetical protein
MAIEEGLKRYVDGVLGLDFFRGQRLVVDFQSGLVTVE